jgi:signal transduction histidine kinase
MYDFEALNRIGQQILQIAIASSDPQTLLSEIARQIGEAFNADACLVIAHLERGYQGPIGLWQKGGSVVLTPEVKVQLLSTPAIAPLRPLVIHDSLTALGELEGLSAILPVRAWLSQPIGEVETVRGLIALGRRRSHQWSEAEQNGLKATVEAATVACDRALLQQQLQTRSRYQALVCFLSEVLRNPSEIGPTVERALAETAEALQVERGWVMTLKYADPLQKNRNRKKLPKAKAAAIAHWSAQPEGDNCSTALAFALSDCSLCARAWQNAPQPLALGDCANAESLKASPLLDLTPMAAALVVPLMKRPGNDGGQSLAIGFLILQDRYPRVWQDEELALVTWVGEQLSTAMLQNQAQRQVQSLVEERTAQLRWSLELQAKLSEKMRNQIDELKRANQIKDEFLATVQDELKHPLAKMKMAIEMLKIAPDAQRRQRYMEILETECAKETKLIIDLLTLQQVRSQQFSSDRQQLNIRDIIESLGRTFEQRWGQKGLSLEVDDRLEAKTAHSTKASPVLYTDPNSLSRILLELLSNAGKFSEPDTIVRLGVYLQPNAAGQQIVFTVTNVGIGVSQEEQEDIFKPFTQVHKREGTAQGTGLGLALVKSLVEHLNGTIEVSSIPSDNPPTFVTSFTLTLPQFQPQQSVWELES